MQPLDPVEPAFDVLRLPGVADLEHAMVRASPSYEKENVVVVTAGSHSVSTPSSTRSEGAHFARILPRASSSRSACAA